MLIVGYGDIGTACAKIAKNGLGMKVTAVKRRPEMVSEEARSYVDEVVGEDQYAKYVTEADFIVGILPRIVGKTDNFFNMKSTFKKMKKSWRSFTENLPKFDPGTALEQLSSQLLNTEQAALLTQTYKPNSN